jgi:mannan endo-1,4-beta-mannosidase
MKISFITAALLLASAVCHAGDFVTVKGTRFLRDGKPYYFIGANFWQGMNMASNGAGGDRKKLVRELDRMKALGITNLRITAASEGPDTEPWRAVPALQAKPGVYDKDLLDGLDYLLGEMGKRHMTAVMVMNNFWPWSGGMAQYVSWQDGSAIPYPMENNEWEKYQNYAAQFYSSKPAMAQYNAFLKKIIERKNPYSGRLYKNDPAIMSWELANEPRGSDNGELYNIWMEKTAAYIKSLDKKHLVTTGCEGSFSSPTGFIRNHQSTNIDYATFHIWVHNAGWFDPKKTEETYPSSVAKMKDYIAEHVKYAEQLEKPLVLEEFGIDRDTGAYEPASPVTLRDKYYATVFNEAYESAVKGSPMAGVAFWAWSGESRPRVPGGHWKPGDEFLGDPPHEAQGWYGVYDTDASTINVIKDFAAKFAAINPAQPKN